MVTVKQYELARKRYIGIMEDNQKRSYGGNQEWFSKEEGSLKDRITHEYGCGVIAITDLFLYWAMTLEEGKETFAAGFINDANQITKENYMELVRKIRDEYAFIFGKAGTFGIQLAEAINEYVKDNHLNFKASLITRLSDLEMLHKIQNMLKHNKPIILMIGQSSPVILSRLQKKGLPFYKQNKTIDILARNKKKSYASYRVSRKNVYGHFVTITGVIIDEQAEIASQNIMLRISSWGQEYYVSYHQLRFYIKHISKPYLSAIISF